jgi:hypothetical protein
VDIGDEKVEWMKNILEATKILIEMMRLGTRELRKRATGKKWDNANSQFASIVNLFENESDLEECNLFPEDYDKYNATKWLMYKMRLIEAKINAVKQ